MDVRQLSTIYHPLEVGRLEVMLSAPMHIFIPWYSSVVEIVQKTEDIAAKKRTSLL